jgi:omega-6 fatty acid desaturase (delta-12 desaturase)
MIRCFALYHDFLHGAILARSSAARAAFYVFGAIVLTPPRSWRASHNAHHAHVGMPEESNVGSFPLMTVAAWRRAPLRTRFAYRLARHPLTIVFAYVTIFLLSICLLPLLRRPAAHWDSALSLLVHVGAVVALWTVGGPATAIFGLLLPVFLASAFGGYLFYVQHNFPGLRVASPDAWTYDRAALDSSSCLRLPRLLRWATGNLGFHHVHHLNPRIPFYRLPHAMAGIPELQGAVETTLRLRDVADCFGANLWDETKECMVRYREAGPRAVSAEWSGEAAT